MTDPGTATESKILTEVGKKVREKDGRKGFQKAGEPKGLARMSESYDLKEGILKCQCRTRKWCFCRHIKELADNRITPFLLKTMSIEEQREVDSNKGKVLADSN